MISIIKAERLKWKKTFIPKLLWLAPIVTILMSVGLMGGNFFQTGAYNWWYVLLLPGSLTICCALVIEKDAKLKYHSVLALPLNLKKIWFGKILACSTWLLLITIIFLVGITAGGWIFGNGLSISESLIGSLLIFLTFLWQIPLCLFLAAKCGTYLTILINIVANVVGIVVFADSEFWFSYPFAISARLMCPALGILPNGLPVPEGSTLSSTEVILPGILISLALFTIVSLLTARWFQKVEAK